MISEVYSEMSKMITNPLIEQGRKQGIQKGIEQGMQQGIQQGKQSILIQLLDEKFGKIPESMKNQIREITDENLLDQLSLRILKANSLDEMGLDGEVEGE